MEKIERDMDFVNLRAQGKTYEEIARKHGISKQCVHQRVQKIVNGGRNRAYIVQKCVYPNLAIAMTEHGFNATKLSQMAKIGYQSLLEKLKGNKQFKLSEVTKIAKYFEDSVENLFRLDTVDNEVRQPCDTTKSNPSTPE